jgi:uncharacterized protein YuzB (UPF0349 family)
MGSSGLENLESFLPENLRDMVDVTGSNCLGFCRDREYGQAPYAMVDDRVVPMATVARLLEVIHEIIGERCR